MKEAFHCLKGWYPDVSNTTACPCFLTMKKQTVDREKLHKDDPPEGGKVRIHVEPYAVGYKLPGDG